MARTTRLMGLQHRIAYGKPPLNPTGDRRSENRGRCKTPGSYPVHLRGRDLGIFGRLSRLGNVNRIPQTLILVEVQDPVATQLAKSALTLERRPTAFAMTRPEAGQLTRRSTCQVALVRRSASNDEILQDGSGATCKA